jgi:uncharacterized BrkB/YihY/UPF0761 family membrane protein
MYRRKLKASRRSIADENTQSPEQLSGGFFVKQSWECVMQINNIKLWKLIVSTLITSIVSGVIYDNKISGNYFSNLSDGLGYAVGFGLGAITFPWIVSLIVACIIGLYKIIRKKEKQFLRDWVYGAAIFSFIFLILVLKM